MNWAKKADRKSGDARILYDPKRKKYVIIEALEDGYFEVAAGTYEAMEEEYEQAYTRATDEVYGNTESFESAEGSDIWNLQFSQDGGNGRRNDSAVEGEGFQGDIAGSDQFLRGRHQGKYTDRDSDGNKLTAAQQKFFANSKVRDENGRMFMSCIISIASGFGLSRNRKSSRMLNQSSKKGAIRTMTAKQMIPLIDKLLQLIMKEDLIEAVCSIIETKEQYNKMLKVLEQMKNPTREEIMIKALLIADPE